MMKIFTAVSGILFLLNGLEGKVFDHLVEKPRNDCAGDWCDPSHEPYPNIVSVMTGYNLIAGNPFVDGATYDPGFSTSYIFKAIYRTQDGRYALHEGVTVRATQLCSLSLKTHFVKTVDGYKETISDKASEGTTFASNLETEVSAEVEGIGIKTTVPPLVTASFGSSSTFKEVQQFFTKRQGVIAINEATCSAYTVHLSKYNPPPFADGMVKALESLNNVINRTAEEQRREFNKFIADFGTHFIQEVTMGSRLSISRKYSMEEYSSSSDSAITKCNQDKFSVNFFGIQVGHSKNSCKAVGGTGNSQEIYGYNREQIVSYGSKPADSLIHWSQQKFDSPLPIRMKLSPILNIFSRSYMKARHPDIDYKAILKFMAPLYYKYCEDNKDSLGIESCDVSKNKGCGWNDNCIPRQQVCINKNNRKNGYYCCNLKCNRQPCDNGGQCIDIPKSCDYVCKCKHPWEGRQCKDRVVDRYILTKEMKRVLNLHRSASNDDFRNIMLKYLIQNYPNYNFLVDSYNEVSSFDTHTVIGFGVVFSFREYGRNLVIGWTRKGSLVPSQSRLQEIGNDLLRYTQYKGCNAKSQALSIFEKAKTYGYPVNMVHVVRFGCGLRSHWNGKCIFKNYSCRSGHKSSFVVQFGSS